MSGWQLVREIQWRTVLVLTLVTLAAVAVLSPYRLRSRNLQNGLMITSYYLRYLDPRLEKVAPIFERIDGKALVLLMKDSDGHLMAELEAASVHGLDNMPPPVHTDIAATTARLRESGYFVIFYMVAFKDRIFAEKYPSVAVKNEDGTPFSDGLGTFIDPAAEVYRTYMLDLIAEAARMQQVDEIMLDYIRYPEYEGKTYPFTRRRDDRIPVITSFIRDAAATAHRHEKPISIAVFPPEIVDGYQGLGLGQDVEQLARHVDIVSTMIYPDQFMLFPSREEWKRYFRYMNKNSAKIAWAGGAAYRPWIQSFTFVRSQTGDGRWKRKTALLDKELMDFQRQWLERRGIPYLIYHSSSKYDL